MSLAFYGESVSAKRPYWRKKCTRVAGTSFSCVAAFFCKDLPSRRHQWRHQRSGTITDTLSVSKSLVLKILTAHFIALPLPLVAALLPESGTELCQDKRNAGSQYAQAAQKRAGPLRPKSTEHLYRKQWERATQDISQYRVGCHSTSAVEWPVRVGHVHHTSHEDKHVSKAKEALTDDWRNPVHAIRSSPAVPVPGQRRSCLRVWPTLQEQTYCDAWSTDHS